MFVSVGEYCVCECVGVCCVCECVDVCSVCECVYVSVWVYVLGLCVFACECVLCL